eukprot:582158-Amphidinium_carterae.1
MGGGCPQSREDLRESALPLLPTDLGHLVECGTKLGPTKLFRWAVRGGSKLSAFAKCSPGTGFDVLPSWLKASYHPPQPRKVQH